MNLREVFQMLWFPKLIKKSIIISLMTMFRYCLLLRVEGSDELHFTRLISRKSRAMISRFLTCKSK